jgi:transposase-like protein
MEKRAIKKNRRKYDKGFKDEALKMVSNGRSVPEVARTIGIGENLLYKWRTEHQSILSISDATAQAEIEQLRKQLRATEMERDILKKALLIFGRGTL